MTIRRWASLLAGLLWITAMSAAAQDAQTEFRTIRDAYLEKYRPLSIQAGEAWWEASTTGSDEAFARRKQADEALSALHSDREVFSRLVALRKSGGVRDPQLKRELEVMYLTFLPKQADPELNRRIIALEADVEQIFNTHRSTVDGKTLTENDVRDILKATKDTELARKAWTAYMDVGRKVEDKLKELVKLRNEVARKLGYDNYFTMMMEVQEFDADELLALFDELDRLTREPFTRLKSEIDRSMTARFGIQEAGLRPWHTGDLFFQEAPDLSQVSLDAMYRSKDPVKLSEAHYESMGLEVDSILARSDLYEKEGKSPHAFCTSIDRARDVRVLCNVKPNANWMDTMHHELGHGVYDLYVDEKVPFILHGPAHILTTEGMAMLFGALTQSSEFIDKVVAPPQELRSAYIEEARRSLRAEKLIFSRWAQVMFRFEREMYRNPDQDLNQLWWGLKKKYQLLNPPEDMAGADYGAKVHVVVAPVYYHNYLLGDLFAAQVWHHAATDVMGLKNPVETSFYGSKKAGEYFRSAVFAPGGLYDWRELTRRATGEPLNPKYYAEMFVN
ncbi:MAG: M2 family metallopeptidase [Armatimonadetes bacterium]|nr:M2 family metallopeptidase [Armatimonadota bacterium]